MFCFKKGYENLGLGKVVENFDGLCAVEYFDSPNRLVREDNVLLSEIKVKLLGRNTRVYIKDDMSGQWFVGRVIQDRGDGLEIRLYDRKDIFCEYGEVHVRWARPIHDPLDFISNAITETPQYAEARSNFLSSYIAQREAAWGISALLSSSIELEAHQVEVVRRVLSDPCQRYLLADEVGLGKTIEAGVIIRQAVLDDPRNHMVIVLVPKALVLQWRQELTVRFGLDAYLDISLHVIDQEGCLSELEALLERVTMLVIDEAHHLASSTKDLATDAYSLVAKFSPQIDRLLLLSATPILRNEDGFLKILHLLDPVVYRLDDVSSFRRKINNRKELAEAVALLDSENLFFLGSILDDLSKLIPHDKLYSDLSQSLQDMLLVINDKTDEKLNELIRTLRSHISETYKLHRRILRNRRKKIQFLTPERSGGEIVDVDDTQTQRIDSLLERWRTEASSLASGGESLAIFYIKVLSATFENIRKVSILCDQRIQEIKTGVEDGFDGELDILQNLGKAVDYEHWIEKRSSQLLKEVSDLIRDGVKVVIFATDADVADRIFEYVSLALGAIHVVRHEIVADYEDSDNYELQGFSLDNAVDVFVCDQRAEEGINLQGGSKAVVHFDLPLNPNRIEQRIGRVDRYGSGDRIRSFSVVDSNSNFQNVWYSILNDGFKVFSNSISSLQYLVEDELSEVFGAFFLEGIDALTDLYERLSGPDGVVKRELKLIDQQDSLDELSEAGDYALDHVDEVDCEWRHIKESVMFWAVNTLMFSTVNEASLSNEIDPIFRFRYNNPEGRSVSTLVPVTDFVGKFLGALDFSHKESTHRTPMSFPHCARRQSGVRLGARLIRYGEDFVEALKAFSDVDDRGRSYVMARQVINEQLGDGEGIYFRFDFLIEADLDFSSEIVGQSFTNRLATANSAVSRRVDSDFPPFVEQIWLNQEGEEPSQEFIEKYLTAKYDKRGEQEDYIDVNLKTVKFRKLMDANPEEFDNWSVRCKRMRDIALELVSTRKHLYEKKVAATKRVKKVGEERFAQLNSRINSVEKLEAKAESEQLLVEKMLSEALIEGILNPRFKVDVVGAVILSNSTFDINRVL